MWERSGGLATPPAPLLPPFSSATGPPTESPSCLLPAWGLGHLWGQSLLSGGPALPVTSGQRGQGWNNKCPSPLTCFYCCCVPGSCSPLPKQTLPGRRLLAQVGWLPAAAAGPTLLGLRADFTGTSCPRQGPPPQLPLHPSHLASSLPTACRSHAPGRKKKKKMTPKGRGVSMRKTRLSYRPSSSFRRVLTGRSWATWLILATRETGRCHLVSR